ncbi:hypothetical protein BH09PAT3_BH09PAT3_5950 [soil metagenome]
MKVFITGGPDIKRDAFSTNLAERVHVAEWLPHVLASIDPVERPRDWVSQGTLLTPPERRIVTEADLLIVLAADGEQSMYHDHTDRLRSERRLINLALQHDVHVTSLTTGEAEQAYMAGLATIASFSAE